MAMNTVFLHLSEEAIKRLNKLRGWRKVSRSAILWGSDQFWAEFVQPGRTCKPCVARGMVI